MHIPPTGRLSISEEPSAAVAVASRRLAQALDLQSVTIELHEVEGDERRLAFPLRDGARVVGTLLVPTGLDERALGQDRTAAHGLP